MRRGMALERRIGIVSRPASVLVAQGGAAGLLSVPADEMTRRRWERGHARDKYPIFLEINVPGLIPEAQLTLQGALTALPPQSKRPLGHSTKRCATCVMCDTGR
jgi:hypothetical protein